MGGKQFEGEFENFMYIFLIGGRFIYLILHLFKTIVLYALNLNKNDNIIYSLNFKPQFNHIHITNDKMTQMYANWGTYTHSISVVPYLCLDFKSFTEFKTNILSI